MPELDRRDFLKIVGLSAGASATAACSDPLEKVIPYLNQPEEIIPGIPTTYASTCRECPVACGIHVTTREGRPIKVDGNPDDPVSQGGLCVRGQIGLARTYDPSRFRGPMARNAAGELEPVSWDDAMRTLVEKLGPAARAGKVYFLGGLETGSFDGLVEAFLGALGSPHYLRFEPFAYEALRSANERVFGTPAVPHYALDRADLVVSFGADLIETWLNPLQNNVLFANGRRTGKGFAAYVGPRLSASGQITDLWLSTQPGTEVLVAAALARRVAEQKGVALGPAAAKLGAIDLASAAERSGVPLSKLEDLAERIAHAEAPLALPPGNELHGTNATAFAAAVQLLNFAAGAVGRTVVFGPDHGVGKLARFRDMKDLAGKMRGGDVGVLLVRGANPVYAVPQVGFADAMKAEGLFTVSFASANDETTALADLVLPDHTPFEAWGDAEPIAGVRRLQQPTIKPLMDTRPTADVLIEAARGLERDFGVGSWKELVRSKWGAGLDAALAQGGAFSPAPGAAVSLAPTAGSLDFAPAELGGEGDLTLLVYPSGHFYDGRSSRIAALQEIPDPVTKLVWGSYAELHPETAAALGVGEADVVRVTTEAGSLELPAFPHEAVRPGVVAIAAGQGHQPVEPEFDGLADRHWLRRKIGVNALEIVPGRLDPSSGALAWLSARARVEATGQRVLLARPQTTFDQEGRGVAQTISLASLEGHDDHAGGHGKSSGEHHMPPYADAMHLEVREFDPADDARDANYRWGMAIDLDACSGCNACVTACIQENNIPTIGEELTRQGREMHWMRLERYIEHRGDEISVNSVPMLCQHCGAAPCESVCPVYATYHSNEGLNVMVPNRCIGTRYCGNNCPYKVRRFNYFPYDFDVREPAHLGLNPDVMVRSKGVMEKCTFCVQRINGAKDQAVMEGRVVADGEVVSACAQACPTKAITFGNYKDPDSEVSKLRRDPRAYTVFHHLNTRPAITYMKAVDRRSGHA